MPEPAIPPAASNPRTVLAGVAALAVAMGIGRFAFTPLLPLMQRDGLLDAATGAEWAVANYLGYLLGAMTAARIGRDPWRLLHAALVGVVASTLVVAWIDDRVGGALLRAVAGACSAWVLIAASSAFLGELSRRNAARLGGWIYTGVGSGIALAGLLAWLGGTQPAAWLWIELALLAAVGTAIVRGGARGVATAPAAPRPPATGARAAARRGLGPVVLSYGAFGFGYIVPATFLPSMARQQVDDPLVFGLTWPLFGLAAALSVAWATRALAARPRRRVWAAAQATMALGTALPLVSSALWSLAAAALLVGGTFMVATTAGLQWARELSPRDPTPLLARMTSSFAAGQIAGPLLVRAIGDAQPLGADAIVWASGAATVALVLSAVWLWRGAAIAAAPDAAR